MLARHTWLDDVTGRGSVSVAPLTWLPLEFICFAMREIDRYEIANMLPSDNPLEWAAIIHTAVANNGCGWVSSFNGRPAATIGVFENHPGVWQIFSFGSDDYPRVLASVKPKLDLMWAFGRGRGMHRLECRSVISHTTAHKLLQIIGLDCEARLTQYGRDGADYLLFRRVWEKRADTTSGEAAPAK